MRDFPHAPRAPILASKKWMIVFVTIFSVGGISTLAQTVYADDALANQQTIRDACQNQVIPAAIKAGQTVSPEDCFTAFAGRCSTSLSAADFSACMNKEGPGVLASAKSGQSVLTPAETAQQADLVKQQQDIAQSNDPCAGKGGIGPTITCQISNVIADFLGLIVQMLGKILLFFFDIFIGFASYNQFANSVPVEMGWRVVRDVVNMFFIVVLLISAFSTIIGYPADDSFHVKKVLPKLLLMAVLINFSRTLIQLLIDFSQVVMLTFVEAFRQSAAGNFVKAFHMTELTQFGNNAPAGADIGQTIIGYLLAMVMLIIACGTVLLLIIYVIGRILGLWIALIFSPIAFFATALPGKLAKALGSFTGDYWGRLTGLLTGGPIIAFLMWLALAVVQRTATSGLEVGTGLYNGPSGGAQGFSSFLTKIGTSSNIASYIIAVALMLMALDQAVKTAQAAAPFAGGLIKGIEKNTKSLANRFSPATLGAGAVVGGARAIDRRLNATGAAAWVGQNTLGRVPIVKGLVRTPFAKLGAMQKTRQEKETKSVMEGTEKMSYEQLQRHAATIPTGRTATKAERQAYAELQKKMGSEEMRVKRTKELAGVNEARLKEEFKKTNGRDANAVEQAELKRQATSKAREDVKQASAKHLAEAAEKAKSAGAKDLLAEIGKEQDKNPSLVGEPAKFNELMSTIRIDPDKIKNLDADALSRSEVLMGLLPDGAVRKNAGQVMGFDQAQLDSFYEQNKDNRLLTGNMKAMVKLVADSPTSGVDPAGLVVQKGPRGEALIYSGQHPDGKRLRSEKEDIALIALQTEIESRPDRGRAAPGALSVGAQAAMADGMSSGALRFGEALEKFGKDAAGTRDMAPESFARGRVYGAMAGAGAATTKAQLDVALGGASSVVAQLEDPGVDSAAQNHVLEGIEAAGGADALADHIDQMDLNQQKMAGTIAKVTAARAEEIAKKRLVPGAVITPAEQAVERLLQQLKDRFPRARIETPAPGGGPPTVTPRAPDAIHPYLWGSRP